MNKQQILLPVYRALRPLVDRCRLNALARPVWAALWKSQGKSLVRAVQNERTWWLDPEVALRGSEAEIETIRWLRSVIEPGMTVIDVGANVGQMTLEMAHLVGPAGRVIAIEPGPGNLALLRRHVEANGFAKRVTVLAAACCATHGGKLELEMAANRVDAVGSGFQLSGLGLSPAKEDASHARIRTAVATVSLDGLCRAFSIRPAVLKIDVEGAEVEVFRGMKEVLAQCRPTIRFGFHPFAFARPEKAQAAIHQMLTAAGLGPEGVPAGAWGLVEINVRLIP